MCDFELAIINAARNVYPDATVSCCLFHLGQSIYRKIQEEGLQREYRDPQDPEIKIQSHMILALAYVPPDNVKRCFSKFKTRAPEALKPVVKYFNETYVNGKSATKGKAATPPRYPVLLWNHYASTLAGFHRTNNVSEGWHNRFAQMVGKKHPDLYYLLTEFQKEQGDTEIVIAELGLGRRVRDAPKKDWVDRQEKIQHLVENFETHRAAGTELNYLKSLSYKVTLY